VPENRFENMKAKKSESNKAIKQKNKRLFSSFFDFLPACPVGRFSNSYDRRGMAALLVVVIIGAALLIMAYSAIYLGLGELEMGYDSQRGDEAMSVADGCMEEALHRLEKDNGYSGGTITLDNGTCTMAVSGAAGSRTIIVTATADEYTKKIQADVTISGYLITVESWQELTD
jgi:hypothetical protein